MAYPSNNTFFNVRNLAEGIADRVGVRDALRDLSDLEAVRLVQRREGYTPCYGREVALRPGPDGSCLINECCWQNFCSAYRSQALPLDSCLSPLTSQSQIEDFTKFILKSKTDPIETAGLNMSIKAQATLASLSRKLVIGSPKSTICESFDAPDILRPFQISLTGDDAPWSGSPYSRNYTIERRILWPSDPKRVFDWYFAVKPFINDSTINYNPHLTTQTERISVWKTNKPDVIRLSSPKFHKIDAPHFAVPDGEIRVDDPNFVPLLNLDIPFLAEASLDDIQKLIKDYPEELATFRNFLFKNIDKIKRKTVGSEDLSGDLLSIRREIEDNVRKLKSDLAKAKIKHYVEIVGGVAAAFSLTLYCLVSNQMNVLSVVGPGGVLLGLSKVVADYWSSRLTLKANPVYFLWMIGPRKQL